MQNNSFFKHILFISIVALFVSCDKDFNEIGSDIIGDDHFNSDLYVSEVVAFNQNLGSIQSNNLPINALGYYNNPVFGKTKASFVTQVELVAANPTFGVNPTVTKVELSLPYFSELTATDGVTGDHTYELDSIYGNSKFKLGVYESNYYLRDYDASTGFQEVQKYYSGDGADFVTNPTLLNDDATSLSQNSEFFFSDGEIITYKIVDGEEVVDTRSAPGMRLNLRKQFFQDKFFGPGAAGKLVNNNTFKEYFRGLHFKAESADNFQNQGSLALLNIRQGKVTVTYTVDIAAVPATPTTPAVEAHTEEKTLIVNLGGNSVNVFENEYKADYTTSVTTGADPINGDFRLYPKGGAGSMAIIDLFGPDSDDNGVDDELETIISNGWLINEANLTFNIDRTSMGNDLNRAPEPYRIYLYDLNNNRPILDYYSDISVNANPKFSKMVHGGIIEKEATGTDKKGIKYKIRLTNHIRNLIKNDSTNVRLGLVVTEAIGLVTSAKLKPPVLVGSVVDRAPLSSVINPLGTILFGNNIPFGNPDYDKRLKLEIYYTKPN